MNKRTLPYERRKQILSLLAEDAPLSRRCLARIIRPPIERRRLYDALKRLFDQKYLVKRTLFDGALWFYQINQSECGRKRVSKILNVEAASLKQPQFTRIDPLVSDSITTWRHYFKNVFPEALILRKHQLHTDPIGSQLCKTIHEDHKFQPDLLIKFEDQNLKKPTAIAVIINPLYVNYERLLLAIKRLAACESIAAVIHICYDDMSLQALGNVQQSRIVKKSLAQKQLKENFFLISPLPPSMFPDEPIFINWSSKRISIEAWKHLFLNASLTDTGHPTLKVSDST